MLYEVLLERIHREDTTAADDLARLTVYTAYALKRREGEVTVEITHSARCKRRLETDVRGCVLVPIVVSAVNREAEVLPW